MIGRKILAASPKVQAAVSRIIEEDAILWENHFPDVRKMVSIGSDTTREILETLHGGMEQMDRKEFKVIKIIDDIRIVINGGSKNGTCRDNSI